MIDHRLQFHESFSDLLVSFRCMIVSIGWLASTRSQIDQFYREYPYVATLESSVTKDLVKFDKSILSLLKQRTLDGVFSQPLINIYRAFTIAIKDLIWENRDFCKLHKTEELQFLRHARNASAHKNTFYWGEGRQRDDTLKSLPVEWRGKKIEDSIEGKTVFFDFLAPGDLFILLSDISAMANKR